MTQIQVNPDNQAPETLYMTVSDKNFDFSTARQMARDLAFERCGTPMILSWKNRITGESCPDYECGVSDRPFWIRYAEGRGANLTIDFNDGEFVFMILKM
jgi:hypothetical protein